MGVDAKHPNWSERAPDWDQMVDTYLGERHVKAQGQKYLLPTTGMQQDGMGDGQPGKVAYNNYLARAVFPNDVRDAVEGLIGLMHRKPPVIEVPTAMEPLLERITADGADAQTLLRRINEQQLQKGRIGILVEVPDNAGPAAQPYLATYDATSIINWSSELDTEGRLMPVFVVLNETGNVLRPDLTWEIVEQYRVLSMTTFQPGLRTSPSDEEQETAQGVYQVGLFTGAPGGGEGSKEFGALAQVQPSVGGRPMSKIPFVFVNTTDLAEDPAMPPLLGLSDKCVGIYRGEADYRQTLFMQGQETLVIIGGEEKDPASPADDTRIGAGAILHLQSGQGVDAKYIGVSAEGLSEMREALDNDYDKAAQMGMKLLDSGGEGGGGGSSGQQSGEALRIRVAARTVSAVSIARTGAAALELALRYCAEWMGMNPEEVTVTPNVDFADEIMTGEELGQLMTAKQMGAPISLKTIHAIMEAREMTELTFEEELEEIEGEDALPGGAGLGAPPAPEPTEEDEPPPAEE